MVQNPHTTCPIFKLMHHLQLLKPNRHPPKDSKKSQPLKIIPLLKKAKI
jgi:hypothetical protein